MRAHEANPVSAADRGGAEPARRRTVVVENGWSVAGAGKSWAWSVRASEGLDGIRCSAAPGR